MRRAWRVLIALSAVVMVVLLFVLFLVPIPMTVSGHVVSDPTHEVSSHLHLAGNTIVNLTWSTVGGSVVTVTLQWSNPNQADSYPCHTTTARSGSCNFLSAGADYYLLVTNVIGDSRAIQVNYSASFNGPLL